MGGNASVWLLRLANKEQIKRNMSVQEEIKEAYLTLKSIPIVAAAVSGSNSSSQYRMSTGENVRDHVQTFIFGYALSMFSKPRMP